MAHSARANTDDFTSPDWPTQRKGRLRNGVMPGVLGGYWHYMSVPMSSIPDAATEQDKLNAAEPIMQAIDSLASLTRLGPVANRRMVQHSYRPIHMLSLSIPRRWTPEPEKALAPFLSYAYPNRTTDTKMCLLGVQLFGSSIATAGGLRATFGNVIDGVADIMAGQSAPVDEFLADFERVNRAMTQSGLEVATAEQVRLADSWWSSGRLPDTPFLPHDDHVHVFTTNSGRATAKLLRDDAIPCSEWPRIADHHTLSMASVAEFDFAYLDATSSRAQWAVQLFDQSAMAVSVRAKIEPARVTRSELRRNRRRFTEDLTERVNSGKMERAEEQEKLEQLTSMEGGYATGGTPSLIDTSIITAFTGRNANGTYDASDNYGIAHLQTMAGRQMRALAEMMICSAVRSNSNLHDLPSQTVACAGMQSLSQVGDSDGAVIGFTERDRQPARLSPTAASAGDALPIMGVLGATGSGKMVVLSTKIPTPLGHTTMGDIKVGDCVLGRDGYPTRVIFKSTVNEHPNLYRLTFSDGQTIDADFDHQWVVSDFKDRNAARKTKHVAAIGNYDRAMQRVARIKSLAEQTPAGQEFTATELHKQISRLIPDLGWGNAKTMMASLDMVECPFEIKEVRFARKNSGTSVTKTDPVVIFPTAELLRANIKSWGSVSGGNAKRWAEVTKTRIAAATAVLERVEDGQENTVAELTRMLDAEGANFKVRHERLAVIARAAGIEPRPGTRECTIGIAQALTKPVRVYDLRTALFYVAQRTSEQFANRPTTEAGEQRMTTGELIGEGLRLRQGHARFAIRVTEPLQLPEADLPLDCYTLGAWLGDGTTGCGGLTGIDGEILDHIRDAGYEVTSSATVSKAHYIKKIVGPLRAAGVLKQKRIPTAYLRGSFDQRLALLQGLMDTDGTINRQNGSCEICLSDADLAADTLELIRSLGIKASATVSKAGYRDASGEYVPCKDRTRMKFVTTLPVFRLERKLALLPTEMRETTKWIYIEKIEKISSSPGACIQVENPDATYLVGNGYIPSSNTQSLLFAASQFSEMKDKRTGRNLPNIIIDLKQTSDHSPIVKALGGKVYSLDDLAQADGIFDPMRFAEDAESGVEMAANMLMTVNPWGPRRLEFETPIQKALMVGVSHGADCIGEALRLALEYDPATPTEMVQAVFDLADSSPLFRACVGMHNGSGTGLRVSDGLTLIKLGRQSLTLPNGNEKETNRSQKVSVALVQMMVYGSAMALAGRGGILHLDEAWMFLLGESKTQIEQLGRLARSQNVLPILYTQRVTDLVKAELQGYISRLLILHLKDENEARAACAMAELEPTEERINRIRAPRTIGNSATPNLLSLQALRHPETGEVIRGSVGIYCDLDGRAVPIEIVLPKLFLDLSSTTPQDMARRDDLMAKGELKGFDFDRTQHVADEDHLLAPMGRYVADQRTSLFADNAIFHGILDVSRRTPDAAPEEATWDDIGLQATAIAPFVEQSETPDLAALGASEAPSGASDMWDDKDDVWIGLGEDDKADSAW